jgi:FdhD protein
MVNTFERGAVHSFRSQTWRTCGGVAEAAWRDVPQEAAIALAYDSRPYVVVMGTPADLEDLAVGFTVTERIAAFADIERVTLGELPQGLTADVLLSRRAGRAMDVARRRTLEARSSCGLCGVESLRDAVRPMARLPAGPRITRRAIQSALAALEAGQALGARTRATHAAAWASADGEVALVREDVGRHNALDKLVGAALRADLDPASSFIVITSRCSYEMVEKTAAAGVAVLAAISAPTALAIEQAQAAGMTLIALARADGHSVFTGAQRLIEG